MSVGSFLVLGVMHYYAKRKAGREEAEKLIDYALLAIVPVMILAMVASLFHLGNPLSAYKAVTNLGTSWLSREVLSGVIFAVLGAVFAYMQWRKVSSFAVRNIIAWLAAISGVFLIWSMSYVYMLETQPVWNTFATPISFFTTTLLLGVLAMGAAFVASYANLKGKDGEDLTTQLELLRAALRWIAIVAIVMLGVHLVVLPLNIANLATQGGAALEGAQMMFGTYSVILFLRVALAFIGAGVFGVFLYQNTTQSGKEELLGTLVYSAFALVLIAEVLGRFIFYATQVQIGI
jgi:anaerobic dimethyl sulfoxide reductase subunit C (anchor subunit)